MLFISVLAVSLSVVGGINGDDQFNHRGQPANQVDRVTFRIRTPDMKAAEERTTDYTGYMRAIDEAHAAFMKANPSKKSPFNERLAWNLIADKRSADDKNKARQPVAYFGPDKAALNFNPFTDNGYVDENEVVWKNEAEYRESIESCRDSEVPV